jgi:hypothetical protein
MLTAESQSRGAGQSRLGIGMKNLGDLVQGCTTLVSLIPLS